MRGPQRIPSQPTLGRSRFTSCDRVCTGRACLRAPISINTAEDVRLAFVAILIFPESLWAQSGQSKGQGGIIVLDSVPVYTESDSSQVQYTLKRGEAVGSRPDSGELFFRPRYQFEPRNGRIRINFFPREPELSGKIAVGWIDPSAISIFAFQCCDPKGKHCGPTGIPSLGSMKVAWTPCFIEARDLKLRELEKEWSTAKASPQPSGGAGHWVMSDLPNCVTGGPPVVLRLR